MEKRRLGHSDLSVSVLGLGCWTFGGGDGSYWGMQDQQDVNRVVDRAIEAGINFFDTAEVYNDGQSEVSLGLALRGKRHQAVIASKIIPAHMRPADVVAHCDASLQRLGTDYIDLYMVHWPIQTHAYEKGKAPDLHESFHTLDRLRQEGKIRHIGLSNHGIRQMREVLETGVEVVANELAYNLFSRAIEAEIVPYCTENNIGVIGYMPLQQGLLTGKYRTLDEVRPMLARSRHFHHRRGDGARHEEEGAETEIELALQELRQISQERGMEISDLALTWATSNPHIATNIVGSRNVKQLEWNIRGATTPMDKELRAQLDTITEPVLQKLGTNPDYYENWTNSRIE